MIKIEDYRQRYFKYFMEFNRLASGMYADLSYGNPNPNPTAGSLESIIAYANYINDDKAVILNSGAGASSWVLRQIFNDVTCNDPNKHYLDFIQYLCWNNGVNSSNFIVGFGSGIYDHVYYDYGDSERMPNLINAIEAARESVYVDDTNHRPECAEYRAYTIDLCNKLGLKCFDLKDGFDEHGRGGLIIEK